MKLLVCVSKTPETTTKIAVNGDGNGLKTDGVQYIMNPYDEWYALVRAIELKEANGGSVTLLNVGPASNDTVIRKGLAIGADNAVRVNSEESSALFIAKQIAAHAEKENYDIVFLGKETIDHNRSEVGAMVAEFLDLPYVSFANDLEVADGVATVSREIEGGTETIEVPTPLVLSAAKDLAEQRIPNMRGIMMAKRKPLKVEEPVAYDAHISMTALELPPAKTAVKLVDPENMEELVRLLNEEAKVI
ncbi:MAG: electron transfer flavoprotein subunit beta/FixA family protein [Bacteroidota bacterium]